MRKLIIILFVLYSTTGLSSDSKKGFHFNLGFGYSYVDSDLKDTGSMGIGFDLGIGLTESFSIIATQKNVFYEMGPADIVHSVSALGVTFYLNNLYFTGAVGVAATDTDYSLDLISGDFGDGYILAIGLELISHLALEFYWTQASIGPSSGGGVDFAVDYTTFNIAIVGMLY